MALAPTMGAFLTGEIQVDEERIALLRDFLAEHWALWESHCEQRGEDPNAVYVEDLGGDD